MSANLMSLARSGGKFLKLFGDRKMMKQLPYDAEVEYLEGGEGQYAKIIGYTPGFSNLIYAHWFGKGSAVPFGCTNFTAISGYGRFFASRGLLWNMPGDHNIFFDGVNQLVDNKKYPSNIYTAVASGDLWIFARSDTELTGDGVFYSWKEITPDGVKVIDLIPVRFINELGETEGAMFDRVSGQLFGNAGTGAFIIGPDKTI